MRRRIAMPGASATVRLLYDTDRPDFSTLVDGNWVRGAHEITFGGSWRTTRDDETLDYPGNGVDSLHSGDFATTRNIQAWVWRPFFASSETVNQSFYLGDTIKAGSLTTQLALRYDRAYASMLESAQRANPRLADLLPAITAPAGDKMIDLGLWSPRIGATYALDDSGRTAAPRQLRALRQPARMGHRAELFGGLAGDPDLRRHRSRRQQRRRSR